MPVVLFQTTGRRPAPGRRPLRLTRAVRMRRRLLPLLLLLAACSVSEGASPPPEARRPAPRHAVVLDTTRRADSAPAPAPDTAAVHGLYVNRFAAQSPRRMHALVAMADTTVIDAFVIDVKDEFGLNVATTDAMLRRNAGRMGHIPDLAGLLDTLHAHHIRAIARIVVFKDSVAARVNPDHVIRTPAGTPWRDKHGLTWVDPYDSTIREYNVRVAEAMARAGFDEIQFDYIRFPEPFKSLPPQVFRDAGGESRPQALATFLRDACPRIRRLGARCTADIFGLVTTVPGALEVGQQWEALAPVTDVLLPMVYPSHYPRGAFGLAHPNADPYHVVHSALTRARARDLALGIGGGGHVRAWLQAFSLGKPPYGPVELEAEMRAVRDAGYDGWVLWNPGSFYGAFEPALVKDAPPAH